MSTELTLPESAQLARHEERINQGMASFIEVGEALSAIRDARLYRATHATFEDYCVGRWGMKRNYANKLISSANAVAALPKSMGTIVTTESQARELAKVEPERRAEVVERAQVATGGKITAAALKEAAIQVEVVPPVTRRTKPITNPSNGIMYARIAIAQLEKIEPNDQEKAAGFELVRNYLTQNGG